MLREIMMLLLSCWVGEGDSLFNQTTRAEGTTLSTQTSFIPDPTSFFKQRGNSLELGDELITGAAKTLGLYLRGITTKELAIDELESVLAHTTFKVQQTSDDETTHQLATVISNKMKKYFNALANIKTGVELIYFNSYPQPNPLSSFAQCCDFSSPQLKYSSSFGVPVNKDLFCDTQHQTSTFTDHYLSTNLSSIFSLNLANTPGLKWQYLVTQGGREVVFPGWGNPGRSCDPAAVQHNQVFFDTLHQTAKTIIIIIDRSSVMTSSKMALAKLTAKYVLDLMTDNDKVSVILVDNTVVEVNPFPSESCLHSKVFPISDYSRSKLEQSIDNLYGNLETGNLTAGIETAVDILHHSNIGDVAQILFITSGSTSTRQTNVTRDMFEYLKKRQLRLKISILALFNTKPDNVSDTEFYWRSCIPELILGSIIPIYSNESLSAHKTDYYDVGQKSSFHPVIHRPHVDRLAGGMVVSIAQVAAIKDFVIGVVGLDLKVEELLEDVMYSSYSEYTRIFLIDERGTALAHPFLQPSNSWTAPEFPHIKTLEVTDGFDAALHRIRSFPSGTHVTPSNLSYTWEQAEATNYIVVVVSLPSAPGAQTILDSVPDPAQGWEIQYHDLIPTGKSKLCKHMREVASMETAALYLSPTAFSSPFDHINGENIPLRTQSFMAFLTDPTRLIANPGLKAGVKEDVTLLSHIVKHWKDLAYSSPLNNYIVRRRIFSPRGVEILYPGAALEEGTDPSKQLWFLKAVKSPNQVVVSPPRLDPGGAGFIITVSKALRATNSSGKDYLIGVVAADYTLGYFYKVLNDTIPDGFCSQSNSRCFLLDDRGNILAHPALARDVIKYLNFPSESQHFTHMETFIATDLLQNREYIMKKVCRSQSSGKLQRYFQLDPEFSGVVSNSRSSDPCTKYKLSRVPGTNLFLGLVYQSCNSSAFCWCSTLDRTCLDCQSWEQGECECPCECEAKVDICQISDEGDSIPPCEIQPTKYKPQRYMTTRLDHYPPCIYTDCSSRTLEQDCYGVLGCSWCDKTQDGYVNISSPLCSDQRECYGGILGSQSPYSRIFDRSLVHSVEDEERSLSRAGPIGPVAGGIMAFFLLLALAVWGYKHWSAGERGLLSRSHGSTLRINTIEEEAEEIGGPPAGHQNYGLHQPDPNQAITVVSPYRMNPSYRRPRTAGTDSDHGYSTMTPGGDQDSEIMSCLGDVPSHPRRMRHKNPLSLQSVTSGTSSRTSSPVHGPMELSVFSGDEKQSSTDSSERETLMEDSIHPCSRMKEVNSRLRIREQERNQVPGVTVLNRNQIIVSATVHMVE